MSLAAVRLGVSRAILPRHGVPGALQGGCIGATLILRRTTPYCCFATPRNIGMNSSARYCSVPEHTATQRAQETGTHPETVGRLKRRFAQQGMLGLVPDTLDVRPAQRQLRVPDTRRAGTPAAQRALCGVWRPRTRPDHFSYHHASPHRSNRATPLGSPPSGCSSHPDRCSTTTAMLSASRPAWRSLPSMRKAGASAVSVSFCTSPGPRSTCGLHASRRQPGQRRGPEPGAEYPSAQGVAASHGGNLSSAKAPS